VIADSLGETACIFLTSLYRAEQAIAARLLALSRAPLPWDSIDADKALPWIEQRIGLALAPSQNAAGGSLTGDTSSRRSRRRPRRRPGMVDMARWS
jgi:hypothetical protein